MKKIVKALLVCMSLMLAVPSLTTQAADDSWKQVEAKGKLVVAISGTLYPAGYYNDDKQLVGYNVDIVNEVAKRLNLKVEYKEMGVDGMLTAVKSGQVDMVAEGLQPTSKQKEDFLIGTPIKYSFTSIIVRKKDDSGIKSIEDFKGKKAAGGATTEYMQIAKQLGAELVTYDNATNDQYLLDVQNGRTDFIPNDYFLQSTALQFFKDIDVKMGNVFYNPSTAAFVFNKESVTLKDKIDEVMEAMKKEGVIKELSEKYYNGFNVSEPQKEINGVKISDLPVIELDK